MTEEAKVAVVTGGTRGIGRAISLALARAGMTVYAPYARNRRAAEELAAEAQREDLPIHGLRGDLSKEAAFRRTVENLKERAAKVHVLVHAAATGVHKPVHELTPKHLRWTFETNVFAIHALLDELLPMIPEGGRIIGLTSSGGQRTIPSYGAVGSSKGALESLFRHYAAELAPRGIAVNLVCPGMVMTEALDAFPDRESRIATAQRETPTGRLTTADEVAQTVVFLCSDSAAQIVGQTIVIDGGKTLSA